MWQLALPIAQMLYGGFQAIKANKELKKLSNEDLAYSSTPAMKNVLGVAAANAQHGYSAAEKAAFLQNVASNSAKAYRLGMNRAGNSLSNAIGASNNIANSQAYNQFAAQDASLQRQNEGVYRGLVNQEQNLANQNTQYAMRNNLMAQQAYGQAQQQGINNIFGALQMGSMVAGQGGFGGNGNKGVGGGVAQNAAQGVMQGAVQGVGQQNQTGFQNQVPQFNPAYPMYGKPTFNQYMNQNVIPYNAPNYPIEAPYESLWKPYGF